MAAELSYEFPAPAKLNLFLHITGRRADGYHNLQTLFQLLDFGDTLTITNTDQDGPIQVLPAMPDLPETSNLIWKAAHALRACTGCQRGATITLTKRIPMGGGLGGGSTDAASTLLALNALWNCQLSEDQLAAIGLKLGADVPVFVRAKTAFAEGVGEHLMPVETPEHWFLVVHPGVHVATAAIFSHEKLTRDTPITKMPAFLTGGGKNDCEAVVRKLYPEVDKTLRWLAQFGEAKMTGTGACCFLSFKTQAEAKSVLDQLPRQWKGLIAKGVNESPLLPALQQLKLQKS